MNRQHRQHQLLSFFLAVLLLTALPAPASLSADESPVEKKLTIMLYMCGSNLESDGGAATADITEILHSRYNSDAVNVVAMLGGTRKWWGGMDAQQTAVYEISGNRPKQVWSDGLLNMGDPATLSTLLDYSHDQYPAEKYALVLWNHGGGPMSGVCWDDLSQSDNLTMSEMQTALDDSPFAKEPLEWIGFDACLMSSIETAHLMAPYAKYMIASQETEPGTGWSYAFLSGIENDADGAATGERIVASYMADTPVQDGLTLSCTDLSKITDVEAAMDTFFGDLTVELTEETFSALSNMRQGVQSYGRSEHPSGDPDLVDLADLVSHYAEQSPDSAAALQETISDAVTCSESTIPGSNGLSVYHPYYNKIFYENMAQAEYSSFFFSPGYTQYMERFASLWLGESLTDWSRLAPASESLTEDDHAQFTFQLSEEQQANFASAQLLVLEQYSRPDSDGNYVYSQVFVTPDVTLDENGVLSAVYTGRTLYCLDEDGESLTGNLHYSVDGEYVVVPANFINDEEGTLYYTLLYCTVDAETNDLTVSTIYVYDGATGQFSNRLSLDPADFTTVYFPLSFYYPTYDGDIFLAYEEWTKNDNMVLANGFNDYSGDWHFHFYDEQLTGDQLFATFQVTDTQANTYSTELTEVINPNLSETPVDPEEMNGENYQIKLSAVVSSSELYPGLILRTQVTNPTGQELIYRIEDFKINQSRAVKPSFYENLKAGETGLNSVMFSATDLSNLDRVTSMEGTLQISDTENYDVIEEVPFSIALGADVSAFSAMPDTENLLAQAELDGLEFQLLSVNEDSSGKLSMDLHVTNTTDEPAQFQMDALAVNGYSITNYSVISAGAGEDVYTTLTYNDDISYYDFFEHTEASDHLVQHSSLTAHGVTQISEISLITDEARVDLVLDNPVTYDPVPVDEPVGQVLLYEKDDVKVSMEQAFVIDHDVVLSLELQNGGSADASLELMNPEFDGLPVSMSMFGTETFEIRAGTTAREYLHMKVEEDSGSDPAQESEKTAVPAEISQAAFCVRSESENGAIVFDRITIGFPEPVPFDVDGGVLMNAEDLTVSCADLFAEDTSGPVILSEVSMPQDAASFAREVSFTPDEAQLEGLTGVDALLAAEYDASQYMRSEGEPAEGKIITLLERAELDLSDGTASGTLNGLYLCVKDAENGDPYMLIETAPDENGFTFTPSGEIGLVTDDRFSGLYLMPRLSFSGTANTAEGTASLTQIHITDSPDADAAQDACTDWPLSCFKSGSVSTLGLEMIEDETGNWIFNDTWWPSYYDRSLDSAISLELKPADEFLKQEDVLSLGIVYQLFYEDGSSTLTDIIPWE